MKAHDLIYLDNNATTKVDPAVVEEMMPYLTELYGNPSSGYRFGQQVGKGLDQARERVAALIGCEPGEIIFTSCGTESTNAAINSALLMDRDRQHIVTYHAPTCQPRCAATRPTARRIRPPRQ